MIKNLSIHHSRDI